MRVNHDILELSAALPNERVLQQLSVKLSPVKGSGGVYQSALQRGDVVLSRFDPFSMLFLNFCDPPHADDAPQYP